MILSGDEIGNSQNGNNNVYCQDNEISWVKWEAGDSNLTDLVAMLAQLKKDYKTLGSNQFLAGEQSDPSSQIIWYSPDGQVMTNNDWESSKNEANAYAISTESEEVKSGSDLFIVINNADELEFTLPLSLENWAVVLSTTDIPIKVENGKFKVGASVVVFERKLAN